MKVKSALYALCFLLAALPIQAQSLVAAIQMEAQKCARALMTSDYPVVLSYTHDRIVRRMGGKEAALGLMKKSREEMKAKGYAVEDTKIGVPQSPQRIGAWLVSLVPETLTLRTPDTKARQESFLLGVSEDDGRTWKFIDLGPISEEQLFDVFPELKGRVVIPMRAPPVVEKRG